MSNKENYINRPAIATGLPKTPVVPFPKLGTGEDRNEGAMSLNDYFENQMKSVKPSGVENIPLSSFYIGDRYPETRPGTDYEEMYAQQQSAASKLANGTAKMFGTAATSLASGTIGLVYGVGAAVVEQRLASLIDNDVTRSMDKMSKNFENYLPNYYTKAEQDAEWYSTNNLLTANFFSDKIIKNLGFSLGALGGGVAWAKAFKAIGLTNALVKAGAGLEAATAVEQAMTNVPKLEKYAAFENALNSVAQKYLKTPASRILNNSDRILTSAMGAFGEASIEGLQNMNEFRDKAIEEYKNTYGVAPTGDDLNFINEKADKIGMYTWGLNSMMLTANNFYQLPKILGSSRRADKAIINEIGQKAVGEEFTKTVATTRFGKLVDGARGVASLLFAPSEALEEGAQFAVQTGVSDYFNRAYRNKESAKSFLSSISEVSNNIFGEGIEKTLNTKEGLESIVIGGFSGALQQGGFVGTYTDEKTGKTKIGFGKSGTLGEQGLFGTGGERGKNTDLALIALNKTKIANVLEDQANYIGIALGSQQLRQQAIVNNDVLSEKDYEADYVFSYLMPRAKYGKIDSVNNELDHYESQAMTEDGFRELKTKGIVNESETREKFLSRINNLREASKRINQLYSVIRDKYENVYNERGEKKYSDKTLDKLVYAASKVADYDVRIPLENQSLVAAGINTLPILESIINEFSPNTAATEEAINQINNMKDVISDRRDDLKTALKNVIELSMRRKLFIDEYDNIKTNPEEFEVPSEFAFGETEQLPVSIKQKEIPEGEVEDREIEVGKVYSLKQPMFKKQGSLIFDPKMVVLSQTLGGEFEVQMPDGSVVFMRPEDFIPYTISETSTVTPKLQEILDNAIDNVLNRKKYADLKKPEENKLDYINSLKNIELVNEVEEEFDKQSKQYLEDLAKEIEEAKKLEKIKDDVEQQQNQLELSDSGTVASTPFLDDAYKGNPEDFRKHWGWLFWSTTSASEDRDVDSKKPHAQRSIAFLNNVKKFPNKGSMRVMLVTPKQEDALGLTGLHNLSMGEDIKRDASGNVIISDTNNALVAAVYVEQQGAEYYFVNKEGKRIGKVGDQVDLNQLVFSTMPDTSLFWDEGGKGAERYRVQEKKEAEEMSQRWALKRKELFNLASDKPEIYSFTVSNGIPVINDIKERNHVGGTLIDESRIKNQEGLIVVSTKGTLTHNGQSYKIGAGRAMIQYEDVFVPAVNHKFNKNQAESIYEVLRLLASDIQKQAANNKKIKFDPIYVRYLSNLLYWKKSEAAKGGANQMFIDSKMNLILGDKKYIITGIDRFKKEITDQLLEAYHTVNNKSLSSTEEAGINKFHERFVEFYVEEGQLKEREWTNYQTYLLSAKYPDGTARSANDTPVTTFVAKPTDLVPYNFKQKYAMLSETEFPALPVRPTAKTETPSPTAAPKGDVVKAGKYNVGTTEFVQNTYTEFKAIGPISFEAKLKNEKETQVSIGTDKATLDEIDKIIGTYEEDGEETPVLKTIRQQLGAKYNSDDARFSVIFYMRQVIEAYLNKNLSEKQEAPKQEAPPVAPSAPKVAPIKIGDAEFIPDGTTLYTSTKVFKNEAPVQFSVSLSEAGKIRVKVEFNNQTGNHLVAISKKPESLAAIENTLRKVLKENYNESSTPEEKVAEFAAFKILSLLEQQQAPPQAAPTQAPVSDIETLRQKLIDSIEEIEKLSTDGGFRRTVYYSELLKNNKFKGFFGPSKVDAIVDIKKGKYDADLLALEGAKPAATPVVAPQLRTEKTPSKVSGYLASPNSDGSFNKSSESQTYKEGASMMALEPLGNDRYAIYLDKQHAASQILALQYRDRRIQPIFEEIASGKDAKTIQVIEPAIVQLQGDKYVLVKKGVVDYDGKGLKNEKEKLAEVSKPVEATPAITPAVEETPAPPPVESAPKKKKGGKKHDDNGEYRLVETAPVKKEKISQGDIEMFKKWHAEVASNLPYEISERIFILNDGRRAYGMFVDGVAKFYRGAIRGTEYHEVFEGIWGAFLTSEERQAIIDELKAKSGTFTDRETGKKIRWDEATDKQIKERIADNFAEYRLGKLPARSLSEKIVKFFKNIIEFFKRIVSKPLKVDQLFDDIEKGRFKNYVVPEAVKYAVPEYRAVEGLTETDTRLYVEDMTSLVFQHMFGSNKSLYDIQKLTDKDLYDYVLQKYQDAEKIDDTDADYLSTKQFNDLFTKTKEFLRQFKIEFEEGLVGDVNNNEADNRSYAPEPFSTDWKRHSGYPIKLLLGTLIRTKPSGTVDANNIPTSTPDWSDLDGFQLLNFSKAFATVMDKLHNTSSIKKLVEKVVNLASLNSDYYRLLGRLKLNKAIKITDGVISIDFSGFESHDWRLFIQFYQTFTKQKPTALVQYMSGGNVYTSPSNLFTAAEELKYDWLTNMKLLAKERDSLIYFNSDTKRYQVGDVSAIPTTTPEQKVEFLKKLGISFPLSTYLRLSVKKEMGEKSEQEKFNDAISSIQKYISKDKDIASVTGDTLKVDAPIKRLAELYVRVENPPHETTRFNIQGERVVEFTENNHVSVFENEMNEAGTLDSLREKRPELNDVFSESSVTLKKGGLFYDEDGNQIKKFEVKVIEGNKDIDGGKDTQISRLSRGDAAVLQFNQNLKGDYYILVPADSSTEWMINLGNNISYNDVVNGRAWKNIYTIFRNYLNDEVKLAMEDRSYLKNTAPRAKELRFFKEILPESMVNKIHQYIEDRKPISEINKYIEENIEKLNSSVKSFIESSSEEMFNDLKTYKRVIPNSNETFRFATLDDDFAKVADVDKENLTEDELNNIMLFRNINYVINNIEMHKVIFGDPYQFKIKNNQLDETKRIKSYLSPRRTTVDFPELNTALNQKRNYAGDILLTSNDLGYHEFSSNIATVTLADVDVAGSIYADLGMTTETDGFSFMMDTTYRELKIKNGQWIDEKAEPWHQWQMAYTRNRLAKKGEYIYTNGRLKEQDEKMISKPAPKHMVEVLKTIVSGNKANKTHFDNVLDKFSQMPVYYSMVEGTNLEKMYVKMWKEKIGYAVYESGRKVGAETLHSVYNKDGEFNTTPFTNIIRVPWKALGVQVETTYEEFHDDLTRGSQTTKISTIDLFDNGVATSEAAELEYKRYVDILNKYHENGVNELFTKLGLEYLGDGKFNITDPIALSESLKHELLRRDASDNVRYAIELDENGQFRVPFESSSAYTKIRDIIFSMVDKSVNSPKMHGGAYVQVPVTMFEKLGSSRSLVIKKEIEKDKFVYEKISKEKYQTLSEEEKKDVYLTDDTLKMPTKEDPYMEVMLPHWFREKLPKKYNTDEKLLTYLNSTEEGRKLLRGIGFRIPTQALSSIAPIRVKGFLPQFAGHTVVVPSEITTMAGSDFDIDKMFIYLKSFYLDAAGDIRIVSLIDNSEEKTKEFYKNVYENTIQKEIDKIQRFDEFRDKAVDIFEKLEQFEEITLDNLEQLSEEDFEFYTTHAVLLNEMMEQAEEERLSPKDYILDQINRIGNKKKELTEKMLNDDVKNKYIKKMYKRALENEYYDSLEKLVTLPENYERNIAPVDDAGFKKVAGELDKLTGDVGENVKNRLLNASYMTRLRHAFITAKRWVGIAAVNLTGHSNAQKTKLYLDTDRFANLSKADKELLGDGSVALPHNTVKMGNREYVSMSGRLTADGSKLYISSRLSGYATTFVDVAKDPYIMKIIKSELAVGTFMFLERIGAGQTVPFFMNQPIIRNYLEQLDESNFRSLFNGEQISYILSEFPTTEALLEETKLDVSLSSLKKNIENYRDKQTDDAYNAMQQKIFMEFLKYAKMAEYSFKLTQASNYDTTRFRSGNSLFKKQTRTSVASATNIFSSVDDVLESTHLGEQAYYLDLAVDAVGEYLQLDKKEIRENITDDILTPYAENTYLSDDKYEAIGMKVTTSLLDFVIQTKTNLNSEIANLTSESETSAISLLRKAKAKFPNDDLLQLLEGRQARTGGPWTIKLKGNDKASGYDENYFTGRMRELRDNADVETRELTTNLYNALVKLSILQGAQQSSMSIKNIIPAEDYESQIGDVVRNLKYSPEMDVFKLGMFYRNQWKNDDIFKKVSLNYRYANDNFAAIKELKIGTYSRSVLMLQEKYNIRNVSSDYIKMDRFIVDPDADEYTEGVIDLLTSNKYTPKEYKTMLAKGETAPKEILGFEKVKYPDGSPLIKYDKDGNRTFIYKRINLYGDAGYVAEYYTEFKKSVLKNGTSPIEREASNNDLIRHFTSKEVVMLNQKPITGTDMVKFTPEETEAPPFDITPTAPVSSVEITKSNYTREDVRKNPNTAYVFTENTHSITAFPNTQGGGSAIIRPEPNAFAIVTKKKYDYNTRENVDYSDTPEDFAEFTEVNTRLINELKNSGKSKIVFPQGFATDKAKMPTRFAEWLQKALLDNFGLVTELNSTKTGLISKSVSPSPTAPTAPKKESKTLTPTPEQQRIINKLKEKEVSVILANDGLVDILYKGEVYAEYIRTIDDGIRIGKALLQEKGVSIDENTDSYQYYGASYTIVLENGVGVDVVGYKGKNADKQKLLNAYNTNPNVDPQNGKPFRKESAAPVQQPVERTDKFKFSDGIEINVPFALNAEQKEALYALEEFIKDPSKYDNQITLLGYAGTGKTTIIGLFDEYLKKKYITPIYTSPTHRANAVTKQKNPKAKVVTLHSLFGLGPNIKLEEGDYDIKDLEFAAQNKPKLMGGQTVIVDESSMVSAALYKFLENFKKNLNIKIIYIGDPAQLKPVKDADISPVFRKGTKIQLTKVERTGDNPILRESTDLRNGKDLSYTTDVRPNGGVEYVNNIDRVNQIIGENFSSSEFANDKLYFRILSGTNAKADEYNRTVRSLLYNTTEQLVPGDVLMGYNNFDVDYATQEPVIVNSGDYQVVSVDKGVKEIRLGMQSMSFSGYRVALQNLMNPNDNLKNVFIVDNNESREKIFAFIDAVVDYNKAGAIEMQKGNRQKAAQLFQTAKNIESQLAFMKSLIDANGKTKVKKTLDYGYAHTIHKSQGGTYKKVLILADTIDVFKDPNTKQQLKYVAMSRASEMVYVATSEPITVATEITFDSLTEFTPEEKTTILTNFAAKHNLTEAAAKDYINSAIANKGKAAIISKLKECY